MALFVLAHDLARRPYPKPPRAPLMPIPRDIAERISYGPARMSARVKPQTVQHKGYMDAVRSLKCYRCHKPPRSQFCHADEGKGTSTKSDCRLGWPGCAQCHHDIGTARVLDKERRREWEAEAGQRTRETINRTGLWPNGLEQWPNVEFSGVPAGHSSNHPAGGTSACNAGLGHAGGKRGEACEN